MDEHILIVDDDDAILDSMNEFMKESGYNTLAASSAEKALELMQSNNVNVVVTDISLPEKDGLELTGIIRKDYDADVIVMTGYGAENSYEKAINIGASDFIFKPFRYPELLLRLKRVLRERHFNQERKEMLKKLEKLAITDGLTKLYNSRHFYNQLEVEIDRCSRYGHALALLLLDIDHFKIYNDSYGHLEGDKVLFKLGKVINSCLRTMDSAYRYGGEEFTVILPETSGVEAKNVAQRIRLAVASEKFYPEPGQLYKITISIGVTEYFHNEPPSSLVRRADKAMYLSKDSGRNRLSSLFVENSL